jgi:hypothetical protein
MTSEGLNFSQKSDMENSLLRAALAYASEGRMVFACQPGGKKPLTPHGFKDASKDPEQIREWWTRWPAANVGLPIQVNEMVLDVDRPDALAELPALPETLQAKTPRGFHFWFKLPMNVSARPGVAVLGPHIDIRGFGSYVVGPPSQVDGKPYTWANSIPMAEAPATLLGILSNLRSAEPKASESKASKLEIFQTGERNARLTSIAGAMRRQGASADSILAALKEINQKQCRPPLTEKEVTAIAASVSRYAPDSGFSAGGAPDESGKASKVKRAVELALSQTVKLFHDEQKRPFARIKVSAHLENIPLESRRFKLWLSGLFWNTTGDSIARESLGTAIDILTAKALTDGETVELHNRVGWGNDCLYYDLADPEWCAVEIGPNGWQLTDDPPIHFERHSHQQPQVTPVSSGDWRLLTEFINLKEDELRLFVVLLVSYFLPDIPRPVALITGEHGSAKSSILRVGKWLVDPSALELLGTEQRKDLPQNLSHHFLLCLDNLGNVSAGLSDLLCRAVTGGGIAKRRLFTDSEDIILNYRRAIMVNSINNVVNRPDLLDRSLVFKAPPIPEGSRREEVEFKENFMAVRARILGGMFDVLSRAMKLRPTLSPKKLPRMADFSAWGAAISVAMGWDASEFLSACRMDAQDRDEVVIEGSVVAQCILKLWEMTGPWEGTASDLLKALRPVAGGLGIDLASRDFPDRPNVLSQRLNELIPTLRGKGIYISHGYGHTGRRIKLLSTTNGKASLASSASSASTESISPCESMKIHDAKGANDGFHDIAGGQCNSTIPTLGESPSSTDESSPLAEEEVQI